MYQNVYSQTGQVKKRGLKRKMQGSWRCGELGEDLGGESEDLGGEDTSGPIKDLLSLVMNLFLLFYFGN